MYITHKQSVVVIIVKHLKIRRVKHDRSMQNQDSNTERTRFEVRMMGFTTSTQIRDTTSAQMPVPNKAPTKTARLFINIKCVLDVHHVVNIDRPGQDHCIHHVINIAIRRSRQVRSIRKTQFRRKRKKLEQRAITPRNQSLNMNINIKRKNDGIVLCVKEQKGVL